jgi:beta-lactamase regulating signal transducer with metallopeptidase domain
VILGVIWMTGAVSVLMRLISCIRKERREAKVQDGLNDRGDTSNFETDGIPVSFGDSHPSPAVQGVLSPRILLPTGRRRSLSNRPTYGLLFRPEKITTAKCSLPAAKCVQLMYTATVVA